VAAVHGRPKDSTRPELARELPGQRYGAHKLTAMMQGWVGGHSDSHRVRQPGISWRRRADGGDEVAAVNPSEDSSLGVRRGKVEWYNVMRCRIARWQCLL
jgi:hypothetical protein